jgi:hypothetical protein
VVFYFTEIVAFPGQPLELDEEGGKMAGCVAGAARVGWREWNTLELFYAFQKEKDSHRPNLSRISGNVSETRGNCCTHSKKKKIATDLTFHSSQGIVGVDVSVRT